MAQSVLSGNAHEGFPLSAGQPLNLLRQLEIRLDHAELMELYSKLKTVFQTMVEKESLDKNIHDQFENIYLPLSAWIAERQRNNSTVVIGINGAQGSGKSTLSRILKSLLSDGFGKNAIHLSLDDLYYARDKREKLSETIHPLLCVRGVPGTHDVEKGIDIINSLIHTTNEDEVLIPVFDKAEDDLLPESQWIRVTKPVDVILFEGWCVGSVAQDQGQLLVDINDLEREEDFHKIWRAYVNQQLAGPYQELFSYIDHLIMLEVPDMESVFEWRFQQEEQLKKNKIEKCENLDKFMSKDEVENFIMYFERITRHTLSELPDRAEIVLKLNRQHQIYDIRTNL